MKECFEKLINTRQSCRDFNDVPLEKEKVLEIVTSALLAPSACNSQPWKVYAITSPEKVRQTALAIGVNGHNKFLSKAKAFIAVAEKPAVLKEGVRFDRNHFVKYDIGELIAYITLKAKSIGVETCIIGMVDQQLINSALELKEGELCNLVVALGYSDCELRDKKRKPFEETVTLL